MEWVELIELTAEIVRLRYYPEQRGAVGSCGEVTYFRKTGDWQFDKTAEDYSANYALHACISARQIDADGGNFKKAWLVGWH